MALTDDQYNLIENFMPKLGRKPKYGYRNALDGILYALKSGCSWRQMPEKYGNWHTIYMLFKRWSENGTWYKIFTKLQNKGVIKSKIVFLDSTTIRAHHSAAGAQIKKGAKHRPL